MIKIDKRTNRISGYISSFSKDERGQIPTGIREVRKKNMQIKFSSLGYKNYS